MRKKFDIISQITVSRQDDATEYMRQYNKIYRSLYYVRKELTPKQREEAAFYAKHYYRNNPHKKKKWTPADNERQRQTILSYKLISVRRQAAEEGFTPDQVKQIAELYLEAKKTNNQIRMIIPKHYPELCDRIIKVCGSINMFRHVCRYKTKSELRKQLIASSKERSLRVAEHQ